MSADMQVSVDVVGREHGDTDTLRGGEVDSVHGFQAPSVLHRNSLEVSCLSPYPFMEVDELYRRARVPQLVDSLFFGGVQCSLLLLRGNERDFNHAEPRGHYLYLPFRPAFE